MSINTTRFQSGLVAVCGALALTACGGGDDTAAGDNSVATVQAIPAPPADPGFVDSAPVATSVPAFVDNIATNQRGDARYATLGTNAGVRLFTRFLDLWQPLTEIVDAGVSAPANGSFPAVVASTWTGLPNDGTAAAPSSICRCSTQTFNMSSAPPPAARRPRPTPPTSTTGAARATA